jgi:hypothetical protein
MTANIQSEPRAASADSTGVDSCVPAAIPFRDRPSTTLFKYGIQSLENLLLLFCGFYLGEAAVDMPECRMTIMRRHGDGHI